MSPIFVVQEHWATRHHFDFRLEMDGVLKSWAVPKDIPFESGIKRLAINVEDHALEYADFQGEIPPGEYGAGKVLIWDKGSYELIERSENKIKFKLYGNKLRGTYQLIRFKGENQWLLMKLE